jgi:hypothetical protein
MYSKAKFDSDLKEAKRLIKELELLADTLKAIKESQACFWLPQAKN